MQLIELHKLYYNNQNEIKNSIGHINAVQTFMHDYYHEDDHDNRKNSLMSAYNCIVYTISGLGQLGLPALGAYFVAVGTKIAICQEKCTFFPDEGEKKNIADAINTADKYLDDMNNKSREHLKEKYILKPENCQVEDPQTHKKTQATCQCLYDSETGQDFGECFEPGYTYMYDNWINKLWDDTYSGPITNAYIVAKKLKDIKGLPESVMIGGPAPAKAK